MKQVTKIIFTIVLMIGIFGVGGKLAEADAPDEKKPYEYEFKGVASEMYNGFPGAKEMIITFDKNISSITTADTASITTADTANVYVQRIGAKEGVTLPIVKDVSTVSNVLTIKFHNLELVDHIGKEDFKLVIKRGTLYFDQLEDYVYPFRFHDLTPGFDSVFLNAANANLVNTHIFKHNEPRNVKIQIPPIFITKIETIHRYEGVVSSSVSPNLSNIDIYADTAATRLKVKLGTNPNYDRDIDRSIAGVNGFSMGQAAIEELVCDTAECKKYIQSESFNLTAYDRHGRKLEEKNFQMRVNDRKKDFIISDYVTADIKLFGRSVSIYDLMASPALLDNIMKEITVGDLEKFGVIYSVGDTGEVANFEQLELALTNERLKNIKLMGPINLPASPTPYVIDRDINISSGTITGNLQLGSGKNRVIRLNNINLMGDLTVDVGAKGIAVLDDVTVNGLTITSAGSNSVHLNAFQSTKEVKIANKNSIRIVVTNPTNPTALKFSYEAKAPVYLEVIEGNIELSSSTSLTASNALTVIKSDSATVNTSQPIPGEHYEVISK